MLSYNNSHHIGQLGLVLVEAERAKQALTLTGFLLVQSSVPFLAGSDKKACLTKVGRSRSILLHKLVFLVKGGKKNHVIANVFPNSCKPDITKPEAL